MANSRVRFAWKLVVLALVLAASSSLLHAQIKVTLLGTGSPEPRMDRFGPSILVEAGQEKLLFDCGRGSLQRLAQARIPFAAVTAVFLTHLHSDHIVGLPDLLLTGWLRGRGEPLRVWGPAGTTDMMSHLVEAFSFDIHIRRDVEEKLPAQGAVVNAKDVEQGVVYERSGVKVTAFNVDHGLVKPAFGYRVDFGGRSVVLSGDTTFSENLIRYAQGVDLLVHEVVDPVTFAADNPNFPPSRRQMIFGHHSTTEQAGTVFKRVQPKLAVYSHIVPWNASGLIAETRKTYPGPVEVGEDLMSIEVGQKVVVHRP